jgi:hypothetical protein
MVGRRTGWYRVTSKTLRSSALAALTLPESVLV